MQIEILSCSKEKDGYLVIPKDNLFYIDGKGGQLGDRGNIANAKVLFVRKDGILLDRALEAGSYDYTIDTKRQRYIAQQHTAEHLLSGIAFNEYGYHNVGFHMGEDYTTVDLDSKDIDDKIITDLENKINEVISDAVKIDIKVLSHDEATHLKDIRKPVSPKVTGDVRIVEIPGYDICACGGFHLSNTIEIRLFKILSYERSKGGYTRVFFVAGDKAIVDYDQKHAIIRELCHRYSCRDYEIISMLDKSDTEKKKTEEDLKDVAMKYAGLLSSNLSQESWKYANADVIYYDGSNMVGSFLSKTIDLDKYLLILSSGGAMTLMSNVVDCKALISSIISEDTALKGGGSTTRGNIKGSITKDKLFTILQKIYG